MLWSLFWVNLLGTIYGYQWYWSQMMDTLDNHPAWFVFFVPDSPTASLFFTLAILYLIYDRKLASSAKPLAKPYLWIRRIIEAIAVVTSIKYGIWAVSMIAASAMLGDPLQWEEWMLNISHLGMAVEAMLFIRFFSFRYGSLVVAALWTISNDYMDYRYQIFPWLSEELYRYLDVICVFTVGLGVAALLYTGIMIKLISKKV